MKAQTSWVLVADGAQARIFVNLGPNRGLTVLAGGTFSADSAPSGDLDADRPGRSFDSGGDGRHAMEPHTDPHRHAKDQFARELTDYLAQQADQFDRLVLVAAPVTLGDIRAHLSASVGGKVIGAVDKDLVHASPDELAPHLDGILLV